MSILKPYHRIWRPVKNYDWANSVISIDDNDEPKPTLDYLHMHNMEKGCHMSDIKNMGPLILMKV